MTDHKQNIIEILGKLKEKDLAKNEKWKARAYDTVIKQLKNREEPVLSIEDLNGMKGVGEKIRLKIDEIIKTGTLDKINDVDEQTGIVMELSKIFGIGPIRAKEFYDKHNIKSIEDLQSKPELLNDKQKIGLKYYLDFEQKIPYAEMKKHDTFIHKIIESINPKLKMEVVGSYRRKASSSGDIDVIITFDGDSDNQEQDQDYTLKTIVDKFKKETYLKDDLALGTHKYLGVCKLPRHKRFRRIDLLYTKKEEYPFALLYFTGSMSLNVLMRNKAISMGYSLSEYGLKYISGPNKGEFVKEPFEEEKDIFAFLGMRYIEPTKRNTNNIDEFLI
jgi:DNA polymerase beta